MRLKGREEIRETFARFMVHTGRTLMTFRSPIVELVDGVVTARTYVTEQNKFASGQSADTMGVYYERFTEEDGALRFLYRHWNMAYIGPPTLTAKFYDVREYGPSPGFPGPDDPTTVRTDSFSPMPRGTPRRRRSYFAKNSAADCVSRYSFTRQTSPSRKVKR
jgi:hypothetical protein